jgi:hypothetical protein
MVEPHKPSFLPEHRPASRVKLTLTLHSEESKRALFAADALGF